jgi:hypothetical protein
MINKTQELSDFLNEDKIKPVCAVIRGESARDIISSSQSLGPNYSDEYRPSPESWDEDNNKYGQAEELDDVLADIKSSYSGEHPAGYNSFTYAQANDLGDYLSSMDVVQDYYQSAGKALSDYLASQDRESYNIIGVANKELGGNAVAAVAIYGEDAALVLGNDFEKDIDRMVQHYKAKGIDVTNEDMERYVLDHEHTHMYQRDMNFKALAEKYGLPTEEMAAEYDVETTLKGFYQRQSLAAGDTETSAMYSSLAAIASDRAASVEANYGGAYADAA